LATEMKVRVRFHARLQEITGEKEEVVDIQEGGTVYDVLDKLTKQYGKAFSNYVYEKDSRIAGDIQILLDGNNVTNFQGLKTKVSSRAQIDIVPLVAGGWDEA